MTPATSRIAVLIAALILLLGNLLVPTIIDWAIRGNEEVVNFFFAGALSMQIAIVAFASGLGTAPLHEGLSTSLMTILASLLSFIGGLALCHPNSNIPLEISIILAGIAFGSYFLAFVIYRQFSLRREVILVHEWSDSSLLNRNQPVSIRFLMLLTAAVAIAIWLIRISIATNSSIGWPPQLPFFIASCGILATETIIIHGSCAVLALSKKFSWLALVLMLLTIAICPISYALGIELFTRHRVREHIDVHYAYVIGLGFFSIVTLLMLRLLGFHLQSYSPVNIKTETDCTP